MNRLSFITDEATQNFEEAISMAQRYGFDGLELRSVENRGIEDIPATTWNAWKKRLDEEGLTVSNIAGSFLKCEFSVKHMEEETSKLQRLCDAADAFSCQTIRGFCFLAPKEGSMEVIKLASCLSRVEQTLINRGKKLLLESDPSVNTSNHRRLAELLAYLNPAAFGAVYDPGNDLFDPCGENPFPEGYEFVRPYLVHIHIKDAVYNEKHEPVCVAPGRGLVDYRKLLMRLKEDEYAGWLSLEPHYRKNMELTEKQMRSPGGIDFSRGGAASLEESVTALRKLMEEVSSHVAEGEKSEYEDN